MVTNDETENKNLTTEAKESEQEIKPEPQSKKLDKETIQILLDDRISTGG